MQHEDLFWMTPLMTEETLAVTRPIGSHWPEPRLLWQTDEWLFPSGIRLRLTGQDPKTLALVLNDVLTNAYRLHQQAVDDDAWLYAYPAAIWWHAALEIPKTCDLNPETWIEGTDLVRWLRSSL